MKPVLSVVAIGAFAASMIAGSVAPAHAQDGSNKFRFTGTAKISPQATTQTTVVTTKKSPPTTTNKHGSNRNRNVAIGVGAAVVGVVIASEIARSNARSDRTYYSGGRTYYRSNSSDELSCRQLERRCDDGQDWACRRLDVREDC